MAFAAHVGRKSKDYKIISKSASQLAADGDEYELLCRIDEGSKALERALRAALSRAEDGRSETRRSSPGSRPGRLSLRRSTSTERSSAGSR
jgi:hypothetical protein